MDDFLGADPGLQQIVAEQKRQSAQQRTGTNSSPYNDLMKSEPLSVVTQNLIVQDIIEALQEHHLCMRFLRLNSLRFPQDQ